MEEKKEGGKKMKSANEMRKTTEANAETEASIMNQIEINAKSGINIAHSPKFICSDLINILLKNGYKILKYTDYMGTEFTKIEW